MSEPVQLPAFCRCNLAAACVCACGSFEIRPGQALCCEGILRGAMAPKKRPDAAARSKVRKGATKGARARMVKPVTWACQLPFQLKAFIGMLLRALNLEVAASCRPLRISTTNSGLGPQVLLFTALE